VFPSLFISDAIGMAATEITMLVLVVELVAVDIAVSGQW
jgi:hypothetical protein